MGFVNNLAGAGGLLALVAFEFAAGMSSSEANVSMRPAAIAIGLAGMFGFLSRGRRVPLHVWWWGLATVPGAVAGSLLAVRLPEWVYRSVLAVVVAVLVVQQLRPRPANVADDGVRDGQSGSWWVSMAWFTAVGIHMGFLQVGTGLVAIAALSALHSRDLIVVNTAKMALVLCSSVSSCLVLVSTGAIQLQPSLALALGAGVGSFTAGRISVKRGQGFVRGAVLAVCAFTVVRIVWQLVVVPR